MLPFQCKNQLLCLKQTPQFCMVNFGGKGACENWANMVRDSLYPKELIVYIKKTKDGRKEITSFLFHRWRIEDWVIFSMLQLISMAEPKLEPKSSEIQLCVLTLDHWFWLQTSVANVGDDIQWVQSRIEIMDSVDSAENVIANTVKCERNIP